MIKNKLGYQAYRAERKLIMEKENKAIRVGIVNEVEPTGTAIIPDADFVFAVVHAKGSDGAQVICQGVTDREIAAECLYAAIDGVHEVMKDDIVLQAHLMSMLTGKVAEAKAKAKGEEADDDDE